MRESVFAEHSCPVERGFAKDSAKPGICAGVEEAKADIFRTQASGPDERSIALVIPLKIEICAGVNERLNQWQFGTALQCAVEEHIRDVVERVGENAVVRAPADERVGQRRILCEQGAQSCGIPLANCGFHIHEINSEFVMLTGNASFLAFVVAGFAAGLLF